MERYKPKAKRDTKEERELKVLPFSRKQQNLLGYACGTETQKDKLNKNKTMN